MATMNETGLTLVDGSLRVALPPRLAEAIEQLDSLYTDTEAMIAEAKSIEVKDEDSFKRAGEIVALNKANVKIAEAALTPFETVVKRAKEYLQQQRLRVTNRAEELRGELNRKMGTYTREKDEADAREKARIAAEITQKTEAAAAEQLKLDQEAARERRDARVEQIRADLKAKRITKREAEKQLREAGAIEEADKAQASADADEAKAKGAQVAESVTVKSSVPKIAGVVKRTNYKAECTDEEAFLMAFVNESAKLGRFGELRRFVKVDQQAIGERARELKDSVLMQKTYPGVMASEEKTF